MLEILRTELFEIFIGSIKTCTFRVSSKGKNFAIPKIKQHWGDPLLLSGAGAKWGSLTEDQKKYWAKIAQLYGFWGAYQAFVSSFIESVKIYGLPTTLLQDLIYHPSNHRFKRYIHYQNSIKRRNHYKDYEPHYSKTEKMLKLYPIDLISPIVVPRLLTVDEINLALDCKLIYRTDEIVSGYGTGRFGNGSYSRKRDRVGDELYEHFTGFGVGGYGKGRFGG